LHIDPNSPEFFEDFDPFEFDVKKDYVDGKSDAHVNRAQGNRMKALDPEWQETNRAGAQKRANNPEWQEKSKLAKQKLANDPEWREKNRIAMRKLAHTSEWLENNRLNREKMYNDPKWQENQKVGGQKRSKKISANGIIYNSVKDACMAIALEKNWKPHYSAQWFRKQVNAGNPLYFYVVEDVK